MSVIVFHENHTATLRSGIAVSQSRLVPSTAPSAISICKNTNNYGIICSTEKNLQKKNDKCDDSDEIRLHSCEKEWQFCDRCIVTTMYDTTLPV